MRTAIKNLWVERSFSTADSNSLRVATKPVDSLRVTTTTGGQITETSLLLLAVDSYRSRQHHSFAAETRRYSLFLTSLHHRYRKPQAAHSNHYRSNIIYKYIRTSTAACGTHIQYSSHMLKHKGEERGKRIYNKVSLLHCVSACRMEAASDTHKSTTHEGNRYYWIGVLIGLLRIPK